MLDVASVSRALQAAADVGIDMPASVLYQFSPEHSSAAAERFFTEAGVAVPATGERAVLTLDQLWWSLNRIAAKELFEKVRREMGVQGNGGREEIAVGVCDRERAREREREREQRAIGSPHLGPPLPLHHRHCSTTRIRMGCSRSTKSSQPSRVSHGCTATWSCTLPRA